MRSPHQYGPAPAGGRRPRPRRGGVHALTGEKDALRPRLQMDVTIARAWQKRRGRLLRDLRKDRSNASMMGLLPRRAAARPVTPITSIPGAEARRGGFCGARQNGAKNGRKVTVPLAGRGEVLRHFAPMRVPVRSCLLVFLLGISSWGCKGDDDGHGFTGVQLRAADSTTYVGTSRVEIKLNYAECLANWYVANPDYQRNGVEGAEIFADWQEELCTVELPDGTVPDTCNVTAFEQTPSQLKITYEVSGDITARVLPFGPLPCEGLTGCVGSQNSVSISLADSVRGFSGTSGAPIWQYSTSSQRSGSCDQNAYIEVTGARL